MTEEFIKNTFTSLITADMYIVIAAVYGICFAFKHARFFDDRFIPLAALIAGVISELIWMLANGGNIGERIIHGIIAGMAAVYIANIVKQMGGKKE